MSDNRAITNNTMILHDILERVEDVFDKSATPSDIPALSRIRCILSEARMYHTYERYLNRREMSPYVHSILRREGSIKLKEYVR